MKKLFAILVALIPAIYIGAMALFLYIMPEDEVLFAVLAGILLMGALCNCIYCIVSAKADRRFLAVNNIWILGSNLLLYIVEMVWLIVSTIQVRIAEQNGGMEGGLGVFLLILFYTPHWVSYLITRIFSSVNCMRALKGISREGVRILHMFLHFFPITDLISAIWVLFKVNRSHCFQQPPIEN